LDFFCFHVFSIFFFWNLDGQIQIQIQINLLIKRPKGQQYNRDTMILIDTHTFTNEDINRVITHFVFSVLAPWWPS
jgi:hypothetical protein